MGEQQDEVILLNMWASFYGMRVMIVLAEKGIQYEYKEEVLRYKSQLLLDMNPIHKTVSVFIHNDKSICESTIILEYIDDFWNDKAHLFPSDPYAKARAKFWVDFIDKKLGQVGRKLHTTNREEHEATRKEFIDCLKLLEVELGDKPYFGDENLY
ncbi:probable glutathione S-transferase [Tanacetum coccineum]|uniref:Glutathione S-transferase n=1 Tax=Tanacetum coccineum TaxID=301880 RepID=A0ABQ5FC58_9ASTR